MKHNQSKPIKRISVNCTAEQYKKINALKGKDSMNKYLLKSALGDENLSAVSKVDLISHLSYIEELIGDLLVLEQTEANASIIKNLQEEADKLWNTVHWLLLLKMLMMILM